MWKVLYGKKIRIVATILGIAVSTYAVYWTGREDEVQEIIDIVEEQGSTTFKFHNGRTKKISSIHMNTD